MSKGGPPPAPPFPTARGACPYRGLGPAGPRASTGVPRAPQSARPRAPSVRLLNPTLRQTWPRERPGAAMCVQGIDVQCVLQFTLVNAAGCALHRCTSRVIHRSELYFSIHDHLLGRLASARIALTNRTPRRGLPPEPAVSRWYAPRAGQNMGAAGLPSDPGDLTVAPLLSRVPWGHPPADPCRTTDVGRAEQRARWRLPPNRRFDGRRARAHPVAPGGSNGQPPCRPPPEAPK